MRSVKVMFIDLEWRDRGSGLGLFLKVSWIWTKLEFLEVVFGSIKIISKSHKINQHLWFLVNVLEGNVPKGQSARAACLSRYVWAFGLVLFYFLQAQIIIFFHADTCEFFFIFSPIVAYFEISTVVFCWICDILLFQSAGQTGLKVTGLAIRLWNKNN